MTPPELLLAAEMNFDMLRSCKGLLASLHFDRTFFRGKFEEWSRQYLFDLILWRVRSVQLLLHHTKGCFADIPQVMFLVLFY